VRRNIAENQATLMMALSEALYFQTRYDKDVE